MNCPICQKKVPFGLPIHMLAAHGNNSAAYERETARIKADMAPKERKWTKHGGKNSQKRVKFRLKHPVHSKLS